MKYWIITDTHFNHRKLELPSYGGRPTNFESLIRKHLSMIPATDTLIHLGDICIGNDENTHDEFIRPLMCKKILVRGNHDGKSTSWYEAHGWDFVCDAIRLDMFGKKILLSHKPQRDDGWYNLNIHGHFHNTDHRSIEWECKEVANEKQKLLAIENTNYMPVNLEWFSQSK